MHNGRKWQMTLSAACPRFAADTTLPRRRGIMIGAACAAVLALVWVVPAVARLMSAGVSASAADSVGK